jgi:threonine dehydrogenase-like Zn-dependent dehydrogenase
MHERALVIGGGAIGVAAALSLKAQGVADVTMVEPNAIRRSYLGLDAATTCARPTDVAGPAVRSRDRRRSAIDATRAGGQRRMPIPAA